MHQLPYRLLSTVIISIIALTGCTRTSPCFSSARNEPIAVNTVKYDHVNTDSVPDETLNEGLSRAGVSDKVRPLFLDATRKLADLGSKGNPNAVNEVLPVSPEGYSDDDLADGFPAGVGRGYMQLIPSTFAKYHMGSTGNGIYDPVANIAAGWSYIATGHHVDLSNANGLDTFLADEGIRR